MASQQPIYERRQGPDVVSMAIKAAAVLAWVAAIAGSLILASARPERLSVWNTQLVTAGLLLLLLTTVTCAVGLFLNLFRMRRKTDATNLSLVFLGLVSVTALVAFWLTR